MKDKTMLLCSCIGLAAVPFAISTDGAHLYTITIILLVITGVLGILGGLGKLPRGFMYIGTIVSTYVWWQVFSLEHHIR